MKIKDEVLNIEDNLRAYEDTTLKLLAIVNALNESIDNLDLNIPDNQLLDLIEMLFIEIAWVENDLREAIWEDDSQ